MSNGIYPRIGQQSQTSTLQLDVGSVLGLTAPSGTSNYTNFKALTNMAAAGKILLESADTVYAIPVLVNA